MYDPKSSKAQKLSSVWRQMRLRAKEGHLSTSHQAIEMLALWARNGIKPHYYLAAGLYRRALSWSDKRAHTNENTYRRLVDEINHPRYHFVTNNKIVAHGMLTTFGIPTPLFLGVVNSVHGWTFDNHPLRSHVNLEELLRRVGLSEVCFKLVAGLRGAGFLKVTLALDDDPPAVVKHPGGARVSLERFWNEDLQSSMHMGYFCEGVVEQHPEVARFHPSSLNTIRTWMVQSGDGRWDMFEAVMRMGVDGTTTDNLSGGGIGARIDVETGRLCDPGRRRPDRPTYPKHPTTGVQIEGETLPMWNEVVALCKRTASLLPYLGLVAVDIAFSKTGLLVMEITASPDEFQVRFDRGLGPPLRQLAKLRGLPRERTATG
jgi:hypothetical protein